MKEKYKKRKQLLMLWKIKSLRQVLSLRLWRVKMKSYWLNQKEVVNKLSDKLLEKFLVVNMVQEPK